MPLLEIEDDVYQYLLSRAVRIGESGSSILRRELGLPDPNGGPPGTGSGPEQQPRKSPEVQRLEDLLADPRFASQRVVTKKYLHLLGHLAETHAGEFDRVLGIRGRRRVYFASTREEIANSGKSSHPRRIPGTRYWAMTNADTAQKQDITAEVMTALGYPRDAIMQVRRALT